jgi:hypothetical protein
MGSVSPAGNSADLSRALNDRVFLAVKRQELKERDFCFSTPAMLLDLCLCSDKKAGAAPSDYIMVRNTYASAFLLLY